MDRFHRSLMPTLNRQYQEVPVRQNFIPPQKINEACMPKVSQAIKSYPRSSHWGLYFHWVHPGCDSFPAGPCICQSGKSKLWRYQPGLSALDSWLGDTKWDLIHFNWGPHDLCYRNPEVKSVGNRDKVNGTQSVPPALYEKNLEELVQRLKKTGASRSGHQPPKCQRGNLAALPGMKLNTTRLRKKS